MAELDQYIEGKLLELADRKAAGERQRVGERRPLDAASAAEYEADRRWLLEQLQAFPIASEADLRYVLTRLRKHLPERIAAAGDTLHLADVDAYRRDHGTAPAA